MQMLLDPRNSTHDFLYQYRSFTLITPLCDFQIVSCSRMVWGGVKEYRLYRRGAHLAVVGEGGAAWYCLATQHVYTSTTSFGVEWLEQVGTTRDNPYEKDKDKREDKDRG